MAELKLYRVGRNMTGREMRVIIDSLEEKVVKDENMRNYRRHGKKGVMISSRDDNGMFNWIVARKEEKKKR